MEVFFAGGGFFITAIKEGSHLFFFYEAEPRHLGHLLLA